MTLPKPFYEDRENRMTFLPQAADLLCTRNAGGEDANPSPGWWNHAAIAVSASEIVEAQAHTSHGRISDHPDDPGSVILTPWEEMLARYPSIVVLRDDGLTDGQRERIVGEARRMVGMPYAVGASVFFRRARRRHWVNCVAVARFAYWDGTGHGPKWRTPDDVAECELVRVWSKGPQP